MTQTPSDIVNIKGLADFLGCSVAFLYQNRRWEELPHVNYGGIRFNVNEVWEYLKNTEQSRKNVPGKGKVKRVSNQNKRRVQNKKRGKGLGVKNGRKAKKSTPGVPKLVVLPSGVSLVD